MIRAGLSIALLCMFTSVKADGSAQASSIGQGGNSSSISQGGNGFGGDSSSISHGGDGGAGGNGYGGIGGGGLGMGGQGGNGTGGAATNSGNAQALNIDQPRQSPSVFMNAPMPTAPCQSSVGGFLSFIGGAGFAYTKTLEECEIRELARVSHGIGQPELAMYVLCKAKYAQEFEGCRK